MRMFISNFSPQIVSSYFSFFNWGNKSEDEKEKVHEKINENFETLNQALVLPYALGDEFTLADVMVYPFIERWAMFEHYANSKIGNFEKVLEWVRNIQSRESIKATRQSDEFYISEHKKYFV